MKKSWKLKSNGNAAQQHSANLDLLKTRTRIEEEKDETKNMEEEDHKDEDTMNIDGGASSSAHQNDQSLGHHWQRKKTTPTRKDSFMNF